jgi:hypothetical protein
MFALKTPPLRYRRAAQDRREDAAHFPLRIALLRDARARSGKLSVGDKGEIIAAPLTPFQSLTVQITNTGTSPATVTGYALLLTAIASPKQERLGARGSPFP